MDAEERLLLEELLKETKLGVAFSVTSWKDRLFTALVESGYASTFFFSLHTVLGPGATATITQAVPNGYVLVMTSCDMDTSLPYWTSYRCFMDGIARILVPAQPPAFKTEPFALFPVIHDNVGRVWTNNHATETARVVSLMHTIRLRDDVWATIKAAFLDEIVNYLRDRAREKGGLPE